MKRILADHNVPRPLVRTLKAFEIKRVAEENGYTVLLTGDKTIPDENQIASRKIGPVAMSDNHWEIVRDHVAAIAEALHKVKPGQVLPVFCGTFVPYKPQASAVAKHHKAREVFCVSVKIKLTPHRLFLPQL